MERKFLTNLIFLVFVNLLVKPFWVLGIDRTVQNTVGAEEYGLYFALFNFTFLFNIILDAGINNFNNRNIAQNQQLLDKHFPGIIVLKAVLAIFYFAFILLFGFILGYRGHNTELMIALGVNQFFFLLILFLRTNVSGLQHYKYDSMLSVLDRVIMIALCSAILWGGIQKNPLSILEFVYLQTFSYFLTSAVAFLVLLPRMKLLVPKWDRPFYLMVLKKSSPFALLILLMTLYNKIDAVMIERMLPDGKTEAGIYAQAYRLFDSVNMLAYLFPTLLLPMFSRLLKENKVNPGSQSESIRNLLKFSFSLLGGFALVVAATGAYYSDPIMNLLYPVHTELSAPILILLVFAFIATSATYIFGTLLTANGNLVQLNWMAAGGVLLNVSLNFLLIPKMNAYGAALSALITQAFMALVQVYLVKAIFGYKSDSSYIFKFTTLATGMFLTGFIVMKCELSLVYGVMIIAIVSSILFFGLRLVSFRFLLQQLHTPEIQGHKG